MASKSSIIEREQRAYINFRSLLKDSNRNIHNDLVEFCGDQVLAYSTVRRWAQLFREGRESVEDEPRTGRPKSATGDLSIESVHEFLRNDPCCSIEEISKYTEISSGSIYRILKEDLGVRKVVHDGSHIYFRRPRRKIAENVAKNSFYNMKNAM